MVAFTSGKAIAAVVLSMCSAVVAQDPFVYYNTSIPIGTPGFVRWDTNTFAGAVNLWLQQLAPNASAPQVPLDYSNTKGFFLWTAGTNLVPGQYFYQLQKVGGTGIIYKSNPLMVVCSECPVSSQAPPTAAATGSQTGKAPGETGAASSASSDGGGGGKLGAGAAAGIGVGASLFLVGLAAIGFFLFRRSRKRRQQQFSQPPGNMSQTKPYPASVTPASPPPHFNSPYTQNESKSGFPEPSPMNLQPGMAPQRHPSHELDSNHNSGYGSPGVSAYQSQTGNLTPRRLPSPTSTGILAPQPRSPAPGMSTDNYQYQRPYSQVSPPIGAQRTPGSYHESSSYGFPPGQGPSPNHEVEGFQYQQQQQSQHSATSPGSHHSLPRRQVGSGSGPGPARSP